MNRHTGSNDDRSIHTTNMLVFDESGVKSAVHISHASNVQIGSGNVMIVNAAHRKRSAKSQPRPEPMITECTEVISDEDIDAMEQYLGRHWTTVARKLCFENGEVDIMRHDYQGNLREQIHQMLSTWRERNEAKATVGSLAKAILSVEEGASIVKYLERNHLDGSKPS